MLCFFDVYSRSFVYSVIWLAVLQQLEMSSHTAVCRAIEDWLSQHHTNPMTRERAYLSDIRVCQPMRDLVVEFAQELDLAQLSCQDFFP